MANNPTVADVYEKLGQMDAKIDALLTSDTDQETRIRTLEAWKSYIVGITFAVSVAWKVLFK